MINKSTDTTQIVVSKVIATMGSFLAIICPITGLLLTTDLPPRMGLYLNATHPIAILENTLGILKDKDYREALSKELKAGLILAVAFNSKVLDLTVPSLLARMAIETRLNVNQLNSFLTFMADYMITTTKAYPALEIGKGLSETTFLDYMNACASVEFYEAPIPVEIPSTRKFLSSTIQGKDLDKDCYEEWLLAAPFLTSDFKAKAAPFLRTIATNPSSTVDRMIGAVAANALKLAENESAEVVWFIETATEARKKAKNLGMHTDFDLELNLPELEKAEVKQGVSLDSPVEAPLSAFQLRSLKVKGMQK